ncbi:MAG: polysaccharide biosynthesis/export family protein [Acidobacteriota bacterium]
MKTSTFSALGAVCLLLAGGSLPSLSATGADKSKPTSALSSPGSSLPDDADYVIGAFDKIRIDVFEMKELETTRVVSRDGKISLPLLGEITLGGLTTQQAEESLAQMLRERQLVKEPQVSVNIEEYVSRRVLVNGAVNRPGPVVLLGNKTLVEVLAEAGGLSDRAGRRILIDRQYASDEGRVEIDATELYEGDQRSNVPMQPGDVITVPYEQDFVVYVNGEVRNAGAQKFSRDEPVTVLRAVTSAGGASERANESKVKVLRRYPDGTQEVFKVNLKRVKRGIEDDLVLKGNDIVVVPASFF